MLELSSPNKIRINLCCNFPHKTKFGPTYVAIFHTKQNSDQTMFDFFLQKNKVRIELYRNCPDKTKSGSTYVAIFHTQKKFKTKFGSTYVAIFHTKQNSDQPLLQFSTQNKIRINLCCNFPHKTKFGSTYVAILHTKQNSDQPMLQLS